MKSFPIAIFLLQLSLLVVKMKVLPFAYSLWIQAFLVVLILFVQLTYLYVFLIKVTIHYSFKVSESLCRNLFKEFFFLWKVFVLSCLWRSETVFGLVSCDKYLFSDLLSLPAYLTLLSIFFLKSLFLKKKRTIMYHLTVHIQNSWFKIHSYSFFQVVFI